MQTIKKVGLLVLSHFGKGELGVILQRIGEFDHTSGTMPAYPGGCNITVPPRSISIDDWIKGVVEAATAELGDQIQAFIVENRKRLLVQRTQGSSEMRIYGVAVQRPMIPLCTFNRPGSGGPRIIFRGELPGLLDLNCFDGQQGVLDRQVTALSSDELEAVNEAFKVFE